MDTTEADLQQRIATKEAQIEEWQAEVRGLRVALQIVQRDNRRHDSRALPARVFRPEASALLPDVDPEPPIPQQFIKEPNYADWSVAKSLTQHIVEILLEERPLRRRSILERLRKRGQDKDAHDFDNLVSHYLSSDPRFEKGYTYGTWTLAMEPARDEEWDSDT